MRGVLAPIGPSSPTAQGGFVIDLGSDRIYVEEFDDWQAYYDDYGAVSSPPEDVTAFTINYATSPRSK
jgi:hypothetical protein